MGQPEKARIIGVSGCLCHLGWVVPSVRFVFCSMVLKRVGSECPPYGNRVFRAAQRFCVPVMRAASVILGKVGWALDAHAFCI